MALSELSREKTAKAAVQVLQGDELIPLTVQTLKGTWLAKIQLQEAFFRAVSLGQMNK